MMMYLMKLESYAMQSEDWYPDPQRFEERHERKQLLKEGQRASR